MSFETWFFYWLLLSLSIALALGGTPWRFPENGKYWLDGLRDRKILTRPK